MIADYLGLSLEYLLTGTDEAKKMPTQEGELNRNMIDSAFFRVMQDAKDKGYTPEDIQMALDFLDKARRRDQKNKWKPNFGTKLRYTPILMR